MLTYLAVQRSGLPWQRVIGLGTQLDTARFRSYLAQQLQVPATQVQALILGEHGDSMVPIWSSATVAGLPLEQWPGFNAELCRRKSSRRRRPPAPRSSSSRAAPASPSACRSAKWSMPWLWIAGACCRSARCSRGSYGIRDVCLSVPTVVGCGGVRQADRTAADAEGTTRDCKIRRRCLRETIEQVEETARSRPKAEGAKSQVKREYGPERSSQFREAAWQSAS